MKRAIRLLVGTALLIVAPSIVSVADEAAETPQQVFEQRIMPIFRSPKPSSCIQCHLSSVDLKDYILPSHTETFLALRDNGLIDVEHPEASKILQLIRMGERDADTGARRLHQKIRDKEYEAFASWIIASCRDAKLVSKRAEADSKPAGPKRPLEVVRHTRKSRVVASFADSIWSQRMRCFPCHTPHEIDKSNPKHEVAAKRHRELVEQYGARMNLFQQTPEATMNRLIASSRKPKPGNYPLLNLKQPEKSLLILKPTAKLPPRHEDGTFDPPSSGDPVSHMGGLKMHRDDHSYKLFTRWVRDYAKTVDGSYLSVDELPHNRWVPTQKILRITEVPASWGDASLVQLFVYRAQDDSSGAGLAPVAFTQGTITPRRFVNGALMRIVPVSSEESESETDPLPPGKYVVKAFVDRNGKVAAAPETLLDETDMVGEASVEAKWEIGFPNAEKISASDLK